MMPWTELVGYLAAVMTTLCWLPQAIHIIRTKETAGISAITYTAFCIGIALWLAYGLLMGSKPIIAANAVTLVLGLVILAMRLWLGPRKAKKSS
ncbi:MAG: SemiSWEET transporter [Pseudomonadota bacterium]